MKIADQKKRFFAAVLPSRPDVWEVDEIFDQLAELDEATAEEILMQVGAIWPVSHSLCFAYLTHAARALSAELFSTELLGEWVRQILGLYESKGLLGARQFMADVDKFFLGPMRGEAGVAFTDISTRMVHYLRGISGRSFNFEEAQLPSTDTRTIYLPGSLEIFPSLEHNIFLYKFLISLQWGHVESRIYSEMSAPSSVRQPFLARYPDGKLAADLFSVLQFIHVFRFLETALPGLVRRGRELCVELIGKISLGGTAGQKSAAFRHLLLQGVSDKENMHGASAKESQLPGKPLADALDIPVFEGLPKIYETFSGLSGTYTLGPAALLLGEFDFVRAGETIRLRREEDKAQFVAMFAGLLDQQAARKDEEDKVGNVPDSVQQSLLLIGKQRNDPEKRSNNPILLDNEGLEVPEELAALIKAIEDDLGALPEAYVQAAAGQAGRGVNRQEVEALEEITDSFVPAHVHSYDEWDYRRAGYRAGWCSLTEKTLPAVRSGFVAQTLRKYQPQLHKLRRQFEMLRTRYRYVRRRRHGDEIDLDAHIEALCDTRAGIAPSDRLFIQLLRDERDIAAMFLVDMSNSTEGWVGVAVKEALVLLADALEVVGDRYAIYGFSGMRRSRSELFHVKHLDEPYGGEVQGRIAAISPKEYTRMGPPIRHLTKKLQATQSTVRLLVVISDGKPEDYDDYKGQYAIEDTRKALLEARGAGVYPFCITIDKSAHDYLAHMFGRGNYIFVDDVLSLPSKIAEMYRLLTS